MINSLPYLSAFDPRVIPYQYDVVKLVRTFNYEVGNLEVLLSGSVGSAKSILLAHLVITHCLGNPGARVLIGRKSLPDLKATLWREIIDHLSHDFEEGKDYFVNLTSLTVQFKNGSFIMGKSWADKKFKKFRSLKLSCAAIEEITENDEDDKQTFMEIKARLRRLPGIKENFLIAATNPDDPTHWAYKYFVEPNIAEPHETRRVFFSNTFDNPFLDPIYIEQLKKDLDPKQAERLIYGKWVELNSDFIYYAYESKVQYLRNKKYEPRKDLNIHISFDFNIALGKPMSAVLFQWDQEKDTFHLFSESVIEGARTEDILDDIDARGLLTKDFTYEINGDAAGKHRDTRSSRSDYDIIVKYLSNKGLRHVYNVPVSNPPVRKRHNLVNAYCRNLLGAVRMYLYEGCKKADEGLRLTKLKKGASYIEDDSKDYQHITTAIGYGLIATINRSLSKEQGTVQL